jgi:hypothetical protein
MDIPDATDATDDSHAPVRRPRLPDVALPTLATPSGPSDARVALRAPRRGSVLVLLDDAHTERDVAYLRVLADATRALADWDGRVLAIVAGADGAAARALAALAPPFPVLLDADGVVARGASVAAPALVIVDQWGEIHVARAVPPDGAWPAVGELEQWLRYLSIRCAG